LGYMAKRNFIERQSSVDKVDPTDVELINGLRDPDGDEQRWSFCDKCLTNQPDVYQIRGINLCSKHMIMSIGPGVVKGEPLSEEYYDVEKV
jgi:hypothetical protein